MRAAPYASAMLNFPPHHVGNGLTHSAAMVSPAMSGRDTAINVSVHCKCAIKKVPQAHHNYSLLIIHHSLFIIHYSLERSQAAPLLSSPAELEGKVSPLVTDEVLF